MRTRWLGIIGVASAVAGCASADPPTSPLVGQSATVYVRHSDDLPFPSPPWYWASADPKVHYLKGSVKAVTPGWLELEPDAAGFGTFWIPQSSVALVITGQTLPPAASTPRP